MDIILVNVNVVFSTIEVEDSRLDKADEYGNVDVASKAESTVIEVGLGDENSETSIYDDLPTVEDGLIDIILVNVNIVFSTIEVEDSRLDEADENGDVDVASKVETTIIEVDIGDENSETSIYDDLPTVEDGLMDIILVNVNIVFSTIEVEDLRLDEADENEDVDVASKVKTSVIEVGLGDKNSGTSIYDDLPTVEDGLMDVDSEVETTVNVVDVNSLFSSVEVEDLRLDEAVDTGDVEVASEVETKVIQVGLGDKNSGTSIYDDLPTVEDGLMDVILVDVNLVFSTVKVVDSRLDEADENGDVDVASNVETTVIKVSLGNENSETSIKDDLPTVEDGLIDIIAVDVNLVFSSVKVEDLTLDEAVENEDVDVASEVETTVIEVGFGDKNSGTSIYDDLPTVEDGLMDVTLVNVNLMFSTVEVEYSRLEEADENGDVDVASKVETTVIKVCLGDENS